uniref:Uncharacterized protein n=1 Tax=Opuntia streptacantha TaxID=393608 RepID=A0A7C8ZVY7_OPUST
MEKPAPANCSNRPKPRRKIIFSGIIILRRQVLRYWLLLPLVYLLGLIICACSFSLLFFPNPAPGSVYRSHQIFQKLRDDILRDASTPIEVCSVMGFFSFLQFWSFYCV